MAAAHATLAQVNTGKVAERRRLSFASVDEVLAEADRLVASERAGQLRRVGNWTLGQTLGHLAAWAGFCFEGYPINPPRVLGWILRLRRKQFIYGAMPAGVRIPGVTGGTVGTEALSTEEGHERLRRAFARLRDQRPADRHPFLGRMSHEDWIALNLRHAELHLGFMLPQ